MYINVILLKMSPRLCIKTFSVVLPSINSNSKIVNRNITVYEWCM